MSRGVKWYRCSAGLKQFFGDGEGNGCELCTPCAPDSQPTFLAQDLVTEDKQIIAENIICTKLQDVTE